MSHEFICIVASVPRLLSPSLAALRSFPPANLRCSLRARRRPPPRHSRAQWAASSSSSTGALRVADVSCNMSFICIAASVPRLLSPSFAALQLSRLRMCGVRCVRGGVPSSSLAGAARGVFVVPDASSSRSRRVVSPEFICIVASVSRLLPSWCAAPRLSRLRIGGVGCVRGFVSLLVARGGNERTSLLLSLLPSCLRLLPRYQHEWTQF